VLTCVGWKVTLCDPMWQGTDRYSSGSCCGYCTASNTHSLRERPQISHYLYVMTHVATPIVTHIVTHQSVTHGA